MKSDVHYTYIVRCADNTLYCGYTTDVERRVQEHNGQGTIPGARYTSGRRPVQVVYTESFTTRSEALKREAAIKKMPTQEKREMIK